MEKISKNAVPLQRREIFFVEPCEGQVEPELTYSKSMPSHPPFDSFEKTKKLRMIPEQTSIPKDAI
ncbi:MAG: hypothetical protein R3F19_11860, partial [Verrucomicrobiales bacterium]